MAFLALFEPEIPFNVGALIRISACFGSNSQRKQDSDTVAGSSKLVIIRPMGFVWDVSRMKRSAMDYLELVDIQFYDSFDQFKCAHKGRIIGTAIEFGVDYRQFVFQENDAILLGKESTGLPKEIYSSLDETVTIPIKSRSLNLSTAGAILIAHAN